jgi:hypothetical protein
VKVILSMLRRATWAAPDVNSGCLLVPMKFRKLDLKAWLMSTPPAGNVFYGSLRANLPTFYPLCYSNAYLSLRFCLAATGAIG